jgi:hypothetical protein
MPSRYQEQRIPAGPIAEVHAMPVNPASIDAVSLSQRPSGGAVWVVIDTDAADEIDDQFAVAYALLSPERIEQVSCPEPHELSVGCTW